MGYELRRWLRDQLPADCTPAERLVALEIADQASDTTRLALPTMDQIAGWTGLKNAKSVGQALRGLAERGWELRVPLAYEDDGQPVFARIGYRVTFRIPERQSTAEPVRSVRRRTSNEVRSSTDLQPPSTPVPGLMPEVRSTTDLGRSVVQRQEVRSATHPSPHTSPQEPSNTPSTRPRTSATKAVDTPEFVRFWSVYPIRESKGAARRAWTTAIKKTDAETIIASAEAYAGQCTRKRTERRFIKHPATWLNAECWLDEAGSTFGPLAPDQPRAVPRNEACPRHPFARAGQCRACESVGALV